MTRAILSILLAPIRLTGLVLQRIAQVLFAIFFVVLHPQLKWLAGLIANSALVRVYLRPAIARFLAAYYEPYFEYLKTLPPLWATFSIALPLAVLEPAKTYATVLIATHASVGIPLWLALQGLSLILIDKTWVAVRPQSRKIRLVAYAHAWIWLNVAYGKWLIRKSIIYQTALRWKMQMQIALREFFQAARQSREKEEP